MQKAKHQGGQTQGYPPRNYPAYPGNPENTRQYSREVSAFHASGTPGGGPGMRGMHHAPPTQPPTPPTSQDIKQPPAHLPPQAHQMPPQSGGQMMQYSMPGTGRGSTPQTQFYAPPRVPPGNQRMAPHARPSVVMSNSGQPFMSQPVVQPVYGGHVLSAQMSGQAPVFVGPVNQTFQLQQPRHQSGSFFSPQQILVQQHTMYTPYPQQTMYYTQSFQTIPRTGGPNPSSQGAAPAQPQSPLTLIPNHGSGMISNPGITQQVKQSRQKNRLDIIDPVSGKNIFDDMNINNNTSSKSGESSARQTPQPNAGQKTDQGLAAEFATRVAIAARVDHSGSPNLSTLQQSSSRTSNYSESESQASPDPQGMSTPSVSPSKLDSSVESISSEGPLMENNITYDANQPAAMMPGSWPPVLPGNMPVEILSMPIHSGMMITDDMMRAGSIPPQPAREYQAVQPQTQWLTEGNSVPVPIIISEEPAAQIESSVRPGPERVTPVVSALAHGPTVEIGPRPQREQFPVLGKGHQQQSPVKRKQRPEQTQDQAEVKVKDQQSKTVNLSKHKSAMPIAENKKQQNPASQDGDDYVQSVQTKNSESKTIIIKKNDSDSSGTKTKVDDSLKSKESTNVDAKNINEDVVQENNRSKSVEVVKCDVPVSKERSPTPPSEEKSSGKDSEEIQDAEPPAAAAAAAAAEPEVVPVVSEGPDGVPLKANGNAAIEDDAKSNNQKTKAGNKRPAQSKMRFESKDGRNAEPDAPAAIEATPSAPPIPEMSPAASDVVINEQVKKAEEEATAADENKEKEDLMVASKNENNKQATSVKANDAANKIVLKHTYESDQWSPNNPEGKKKYDRHFIMALQNQPQSLKKPLNFPNLDLLSDNNKQRPFDRNVINSMNRSHVDNIYPSFANKNSSQRGQPIPKRGSQQGKPKVAKPAVVQVSLQQDVKLHETENAWKPTRITEPVDRTEEETETEDLYKRVRGILNKLTPEKFNKLVQQVKELPINNPTRLEGVIDLVFKKAVDEPSFSVAYAQMCSTLQKMEVPSNQVRSDGKPEPEKNFRKLLLNRCQQEFEKNTAAELKRDERLKEIDLEKDPDKKKVLQLAFEEEERRIRMRSVGNIRFIGELYKLHMLTCKIMHNCISQLLSQGDEESLECLCKLLTTIGQGLEHQSKANRLPDINIYFKKLNDIVKNKGSGKVSSRVRFMIQDLIDLKNNKWVPRRNESQPKTIDQIQKETERENIEMNLAYSTFSERNKRQDMRNSMDGRKRGAPDSSGWTTVTNSQPNKSRLIVESAKLKLEQSDVEVASTLSLGNRNQFVWGQSASSGKMDDKRSLPQLVTNKFALLSASSADNVKRSSIEKDRMNSYKSLEDEVRSSKSNSQQDKSSRSSSRESASSKRDDSRFISSSNNKAQVPVAPTPAISDEDDSEVVTKNTKLLLHEYLCILDVNDATKDLEEFFEPADMSKFVTSILLQGMDKKGSEPRRSIGVLMNHFISASKRISKEQFTVGLSKVLEAADDLKLDMPCLWDYLAELLVEMCAKEVLTFRDIASAITPIRGSPGSAEFLAALVKILIETKDVAWLKERWTESEVSLTDIINEKKVNDFVKQNNVEFMLGIKSELSRMIAAKASFDKITTWVSENVGEEKSTEPLFVRTLMTAILEAVVTRQSSSYKVDADLLMNYEQLIIRYTNHEENLELPCLFAIQAFIHKLEYPLGILHSICEQLWDSGVFATESFKVWRNSSNSQEQEGHAVCITALTSFFTHLEECETDEES